MSVMNKVKESLSLKTSISLAIPMLVLIVLAAIYLTNSQMDTMEELTLDKARVAAKLGARVYGEKLDAAIDLGVLTVQEVFSDDYQVIEGYDWGDTPRYHSKFDSYTDHAVLRMQDEFLENPDFVFAIGQDERGYIPTHNSRYQQQLTGDPEKDLAGNRTKRIFTDPVAVAVSENTESILVQEYNQDTAARLWDVSSPVYVKGKHWGAFRLAVSMERVAEKTQDLLYLLSGVFLIFAVATVAAIMAIMNRAMKPVVQLTASANQISLGEGLETPIEPATVDEIGRLARAIDRLRISMRAAMGRLGE